MRPAAEYLRMSTEHQQYSLQNQAAMIRRYASEKSFEVIKSYTDIAKSGLSLRSRKGLQQLLEDVLAGPCGFQVILVYDVSRWGRFQDSDEAAHYEFICRQAGVPVEYCAEPFSNDLSISSSLLKSLKRSMAAEYVRELSVKVRRGHERLAALGYKQGGMAGYGLRRMTVPCDRARAARVLEFGERKGILTDRVTLVPGPEEEIRVVREIFRLFALKDWTMQAIADHLNQRGVRFSTGSRWNKHHIRRILSGPKYVGNHVYGRTTQAMVTPLRREAPERWIVKEGAFQIIVSKKLFDAAQAKITSFTHNQTDEQILIDIKRLWRRKGRLSREIIDECSWVSSISTIEKRFGGLVSLYKRIGYDCQTRRFNPERASAIKQAKSAFMSKVCASFPGDFEIVLRGWNWGPRLRAVGLNLDVSVSAARIVKTKTGRNEWWCNPNPREIGLPWILLRLKDDYTLLDTHLFKECPEVKTLVFSVNDEKFSSAALVQPGRLLTALSRLCPGK